jgi:DNA-binding transcriptional ArsR family regulator
MSNYRRPARVAAREVQLIRVLKAIAHAQRFRMLQELVAVGELSCGQLGTRFALSQPTVSHHLRVLLDAGLVEVRQAGQHRFLSARRDRVRRLTGMLIAQLGGANEKPKRGASNRSPVRAGAYPRLRRTAIPRAVAVLACGKPARWKGGAS